MKKLFFALCVGLFILAFAGSVELQAQGHWEFSGHYGRWNLNLLGSIFEKEVNEALQEQIQEKLFEDIGAQHPMISGGNYLQTLDFKSEGSNYGFGVRWYPGGHKGGFSLGLAVHKSTFKILPNLGVEWDLYDGEIESDALFTGTGSVEGLIEALSFHLTFRFDFFPSWVITPYLTIGGGISTSKVLDDSSLGYDYSGQLAATGYYTESYSGSETKTLRQIIDDEDIDIPIRFLPILELNFGLKGKITKNIHILVDAGVFDGLLIRGGLAIRL